MEKEILKILNEFLSLTCKDNYLFKEEIDIFDDYDKYYFFKKIFIRESENYIFPYKNFNDLKIQEMTREEKEKLKKLITQRNINNF